MGGEISKVCRWVLQFEIVAECLIGILDPTIIRHKQNTVTQARKKCIETLQGGPQYVFGVFALGDVNSIDIGIAFGREGCDRNGIVPSPQSYILLAPVFPTGLVRPAA